MSAKTFLSTLKAYVMVYIITKFPYRVSRYKDPYIRVKLFYPDHGNAIYFAEAYSEPRRTTKMQLFAKKAND